MLGELRELWKFRELLLTMVRRDLKIRYKNSALGFLWSLINPLITVAVMSFALGIMRPSAPSITAYLLAAYLPFIFFQLSLLDSAQTILSAMPLIKKIYFPREILPIAAVTANFIHLILAMFVFFGYLLVNYILHPGAWPFQAGMVFLPLLLTINYALTLGLAFVISALNTFYEDVKYLVSVVVWLLLFLCPVMYFTEDVANSAINGRTGGLFYKIYQLNPVAELCTAYRALLLAPPELVVNGKHAPPLPFNWHYLEATCLTSVVTLLVGYSIFNKLKWKFVERP